MPLEAAVIGAASVSCFTLDESGTRDPTIRDYFQKTEGDLIRGARDNWVILYAGGGDQNNLRLSPILPPIEIRADVRKH